MRKYVAEFFGTMILVFIGCGTAMLVGCDSGYGGGYVLTAAAFGLAIVAGAYSIGNISGCHVNPAVSLAMFINGRMSSEDLLGYIVGQVLGAFGGAGMLICIFTFGDVTDMTGSLGANGLIGVNDSWEAGLLAEILLTFIFVLTVMGVTSPNENHGSFGGLIIGLTLTAVHIVGIGLTGTSVNPARSIAPAVYCWVIYKDSYALLNLWVFIAGPLMGAAAAAGVYNILETANDGASGSSAAKPPAPSAAPPAAPAAPAPSAAPEAKKQPAATQRGGSSGQRSSKKKKRK